MKRQVTMSNEPMNPDADRDSPDAEIGTTLRLRALLRTCKECHKPLPKAVNKPVLKGKSLISWVARTLGYCRYCYKMNHSMRPAHSKYMPMPEFYEAESVPGAEVFDPAKPFDWYEAHMPESER